MQRASERQRRARQGIVRTRRNKRAAETIRRKKGEARIIRGLGRNFGFPNTMITKLRYCDNISLTSTLGVRALQVYSANGIFDPDITGIGHQPMYRDNYAAIYDHYTVIGSKITVTFSSITNNTPMVCGIMGNDDSVVTLTVTTLQEGNNAVSQLIGSNGSETGTLTNWFSPLQMFGVDTKDDGGATTVVGANPSEGYFFGVWAATGDVASTGILWAKVQIEYTVKFQELSDQPQN